MNAIRICGMMLLMIHLLDISRANGQEVTSDASPKASHFYILSSKNIGNNHAGKLMQDKWDTLDNSKIRVTYEVWALRDTLSPSLKQTDIMILEIGNKWVKSYGQTQWRINHNRTLHAGGKDQIAYPDLQDLVIDFSVYRNMITDSLINLQTLPFFEDRAVVYSEEKPLMDWCVSSEIKQISGYSCHRGTTRFRGRDWIVWFTPEIPVDGGLWKFNGLPGLILEAEDSRMHYHFLVREIMKAHQAILFYNVPTNNMSRDKWMKLAQKVYRHPVDFYRTEEKFYLFDLQTKAMNLLDDTWTIPYNPIELE